MFKIKMKVQKPCAKIDIDKLSNKYYFNTKCAGIYNNNKFKANVKFCLILKNGCSTVKNVKISNLKLENDSCSSSECSIRNGYANISLSCSLSSSSSSCGSDNGLYNELMSLFNNIDTKVNKKSSCLTVNFNITPCIKKIKIKGKYSC